jgi:hypothetical protein
VDRQEEKEKGRTEKEYGEKEKRKAGERTRVEQRNAVETANVQREGKGTKTVSGKTGGQWTSGERPREEGERRGTEEEEKPKRDRGREKGRRKPENPAMRKGGCVGGWVEKGRAAVAGESGGERETEEQGGTRGKKDTHRDVLPRTDMQTDRTGTRAPEEKTPPFPSPEGRKRYRQGEEPDNTDHIPTYIHTCTQASIHIYIYTHNIHPHTNTHTCTCIDIYADRKAPRQTDMYTYRHTTA